MNVRIHPPAACLAAVAGAGLLFVATVAGAVEPAAAAARTLSLEDCIREALARNHDLRIARYEPQIASNRVRLALGNYDPTLRLDAQHESAEEPGGLDDFNEPVTASESEAMRYAASFGGQAPSGASYSLNVTARDTEGDRRTVDTSGNSTLAPFAVASGQATFLELRQPLLRNAWIDETRYTVRVRRADLRSSELAVRAQLMNVVAQVEVAYFDLLAAQETVRVRQAALGLAERLVRENSLRVRIGVMEPLDERQAQAQMAASRADLIEAQRALATQETTLKNLISDDIGNWAGTAIAPAEPLAADPADLDTARSRDEAYRSRPDLHQALVDLERRGLLTAYQRNQLFPQVDLVGTYGHAASSDELAGTFDQLGDGSFPYYTVGLSVSIPLGNRRAREGYRVSVAERDRAEDQLRQLRQTIAVQVDNAVVAARSSFERIAATREAREFAEAALAAGETKLAAGKLRSYEVLQLQRDLTSARAEEIRALADYNKSLALLRQREGSTLRHRRIDVETEAAP
jgi:outer membrane protein TolC